MTVLCQLCRSSPPIKGSHVIPAMVFRAIKSDSFTGYLRNPNQPNMRLQDGDKVPLLCDACERRFCERETEFATIFQPFHENDRDVFAYGPWLHYFLTSIAWRTLVLDLPGISADESVPRIVVDNLQNVANRATEYLLGATALASNLNNHLVTVTNTGVCSPDMAAIGPNVMFRRSAFGYTMYDKRHGYAAVAHNLAGMVCVLIVKGKPQDKWEGTKISPQGGEITQPQHVRSWILGDVMTTLKNAKSSLETNLSARQSANIDAAMSRNPTAGARRIFEADRRLKTDRDF